MPGYELVEGQSIFLPKEVRPCNFSSFSFLLYSLGGWMEGGDKVAQTGNRDERDGDGERRVDGWSER